MIRKAFKMSVHADQHDEYVRRHNPIWPALEEVLRAHGVDSYSIFLDVGTNELFAYVEFRSEDEWNAIAVTEVCQRWWQYMCEVMPSNPDNSPVSDELREVFHLERR
jgi:L-rhamnose mutarotase